MEHAERYGRRQPGPPVEEAQDVAVPVGRGADDEVRPGIEQHSVNRLQEAERESGSPVLRVDLQVAQVVDRLDLAVDQGGHAGGGDAPHDPSAFLRDQDAGRSPPVEEPEEIGIPVASDRDLPAHRRRRRQRQQSVVVGARRLADLRHERSFSRRSPPFRGRSRRPGRSPCRRDSRR